MNNKTPRILLTPGEPAGIGPDITAKIASFSYDAELVAIGDPDLLSKRAHALNLPLKIIEADLKSPRTLHQPGTIKVLPIKLQDAASAGVLNRHNARYVLNTLKKAAEICLDQAADALVTGPVHKEIINQAGIPFTGHTEFFRDVANVPHTVMLFVVDDLKVALATTHLPLKDVAKAITPERLTSVLSVLRAGLQNQFKVSNPRIMACGLNPHAGEGGYLGREEIDVLAPLFAELRSKNFDIVGPLPADSVFTQTMLTQCDVVLAMYHDQALPLVKYIGFGHAVNVTLGLPFIRTSVDHGTAIDIAGTDKADASSLDAAIKLAMKLAG